MLWVRPFPLQVLADASDIDIDFARALEKAELDATGQFLETDEGSMSLLGSSGIGESNFIAASKTPS